jgi:phosphohistidine swiveling domain-containing protein
MELTREFKNIGKHDANIAGGKGASLGEMTQAGIPVPPGYVLLSNAFERFIEETDLNVEIDTILHKVDHKEIHTVDKASEDIKALILNAQMPVDIETEIKAHFKKLGAKFVAVRSSATAEDSASAAWAGQLDTFLNTTEEVLIEKVKHCWASLFTPRAIFYRFEKGLHNTKISVAVVVQKMVDSEISGIAFSVHPVTEDYNQLIIEGGFGLGEAIVSGQITPDSYVVEKNPRRIIDVNVSSQERGLYKKIGGGSEWRDISSIEGEKQKLSEAQILELSEIILGIEKHYGFPCDIEWAYAEGKFYVTQSRPITTLSSKKKLNCEISNEDKEVWVENFSGECGYNLISQFISFGMWKFQKALFGKNNPLVLDGCFIDCHEVKIAGFYKEKQLNALIEKLIHLIYQDTDLFVRNHKETYKLIEKCFKTSRKNLKKNLSKLSNKELAKAYIDVLTDYENSHQQSLGSTWYIDSHGGTFAKSLLERTKNLVSEHDAGLNPAEVFTILTTSEKISLGRQEEIESLKVLKSILSNPKSRKIFSELKSFNQVPVGISGGLKKSILSHYNKWFWTPFGYLGPAYGLDYYLSVWSGLVKEGIDVNKELKRHFEFSKQTRLKKQALFKKFKISKELKKVFNLAADITFLKGYRKDATYYTFYVLSVLFTEISKRISLTVRETNLLLHTEIESLLIRGDVADREEIEKRKKHAVVSFSNDILVVYSGQDADKFMSEKFIKKDDTNDASSDMLHGTCACSGKAKGHVKIVNKPEEMSKMEQGDIMVSHTTFPSLVPAMKKASAIVTEDGGITCHAAIVARELGTPCVTGIKIITQVVKDGDLVEVDADNGVVTIIERQK